LPLFCVCGLCCCAALDRSFILPVGCRVCVAVDDVYDDAGVLQMS